MVAAALLPTVTQMSHAGLRTERTYRCEFSAGISNDIPLSPNPWHAGDASARVRVHRLDSFETLYVHMVMTF